MQKKTYIKISIIIYDNPKFYNRNRITFIDPTIGTYCFINKNAKQCKIWSRKTAPNHMRTAIAVMRKWADKHKYNLRLVFGQKREGLWEERRYAAFKKNPRRRCNMCSSSST